MMVRLGMDGRELKDGVRTGIGRYAVEVLRAASQAGWECVVYGNRNTRLPTTFPGVTVQILSAPSTQWWDQVTLPRQLVRDRITVFLSPYYKAPLWSSCPVVLTIHDLYFIGYPGTHRLLIGAARTALARMYAARAAAIVTDSEFSKRSIIGQLTVPSGKISVIPVAADPRFGPTPLDQETGCRYGLSEPYILYLGNFKPHKNLPRLLQAYAQLDPSIRKQVALVLAGGDQVNKPTLVRMAEELGITDYVKFPGLIEDDDLPAVYSGARLCVLPSLVEGFGLPALEAMRCGTPVAASNRAAIPEVVGDAAALFDPDNVDSIRRALAPLLTQRELAEEYKTRGLARSAMFSPERTAGQVIELLKRVGVSPQGTSSASALAPSRGRGLH